MATNRGFTKYCAISLYLLVLACLSVKSTHAVECNVACATSSDYQHPTSFLEFSRSHFQFTTSKKNKNDAPLDRTWRHRFDIVITQDAPRVTVFDHQGDRHVFDMSEAHQYNALSENSGTLSLDDDQFKWTNGDGVIHKFQGSYLTEITSPENETLQLHYTRQKLMSIVNAQGESIDLNYENDAIVSITTPLGITTELVNRTCRPLTTTADDACDTHQHPLPGFNAQPQQPGVVALDARPGSCGSYFIEYFGTTRGSEIEEALAALAPYQHMQTTIRSFPIVDFVGDDQWVVVRSRDLANPSFNSEVTPNALFYRLMRDGREIQDRFLTPLENDGFVSAEEQGVTTTLNAGPEPHNLVLQLVIRHQIASSSHWQQIARARELLTQRYDIQLEVVLIP